MSGITHILDMAVRALMSEQVGLEVTGHNVANVNTPGYSRQRVNLETAYPLPSPWGPLGNGVRVRNIDRAFDPFIAARLDERTAALSEYQNLQAFLESVAAIFNETNETALNDRLSEFWASWHDLADNPSGSAERQALLQNALSLCEILNFQGDRLVQERTSLLQQVGPLLAEINGHAARIAELNREIQSTEAGGQSANDLRDQRQLELTRLSELVGIRYYTSADGLINVNLAQGTPLVQGVAAFSLEAGQTASDTIAVLFNGPGGVQEDITASLYGGKLTALLTVRDHLIPGYLEQLDRLAQELIFTVNSRHAQGAGLELFSAATGTYAVNDPADPLNAAGLPFGDRIAAGAFEILVERDGVHLATGNIAIAPGMTLNDVVNAINADPAIGGLVTASLDGNKLRIAANLAGDAFGFARDDSNLLSSLGLNTFFTGDKAYTLTVNPWVLDNPEHIAAGQFDPDGARAPGDNRNALILADLEDAPAGPDGLTFAEAYRRLITDIGLDTEQAGQEAGFQQKLVEQLSRMREAVSGVSLDEELANLIKFQRAYQAAARLVTVADELYQTILAMRR
ncbi:MAG: flagellar hook-associated protein FlgK [Deltaproteobacteria bacterium]|nr:flagellar hook-associated protein FlgK [Deltaproteobacteria bacterium]